MEPTHEYIQELLGAYALDAVDPDERDLVDDHLRGCPRCRAEVADHREVAALLAHTGTSAPAGVWDRIVESLDETDQVPAMRLSVVPRADAPPAPSVTDDSQPRLPGADRGPSNVTSIRNTQLPRRAAGFLAAAAAVLVVLGIVGGWSLGRNSQDDQVAQQPATLEQVAERAHDDASATQVELKTPTGDNAAPLALLPDGKGFLDATTMPALAADKTYQLWGRTHNETISLGTFDGGAKVVPFQIGSEVDRFAVTVEEEGGVISSEQNPVMVGEVS